MFMRGDQIGGGGRICHRKVREIGVLPRCGARLAPNMTGA